MNVGLVTCKKLPEPDPDAAPLEGALRRRGHVPVMLAWDDPSCGQDRLNAFGLDVIVIRSSWNYFTAPHDFTAWIESAHKCAPVINTSEVVKWNIHKGYLLQLAAAGVATVPTTLIQASDGGAVNAAIASFGDVVIKPAISAGSFGAKRFAASESLPARNHASAILTHGDVLIQPFVEGFEHPGERSLVWIDGQWTHAVRKKPRFDGETESVAAGEPPNETELAIANAALQVVPHKLYYARADMVETEIGPVLSELELMEPSLFFDHSESALTRFIAMVESIGANGGANITS